MGWASWKVVSIRIPPTDRCKSEGFGNTEAQFGYIGKSLRDSAAAFATAFSTIVFHFNRPIACATLHTFMISEAKQFLIGIACLISLTGCESSPETTGPDSPVTAELSQNTTKLAGNPLWNLEAVGPIIVAPGQKTFDAPASGSLQITGWAVDSAAKAPAGGVEVLIDGKPYSASYGRLRDDVVKVHGVAAYAKSNFAFDLKAEDIGAGSHTAVFHILTNDRKSYWESEPYSIVLK